MKNHTVEKLIHQLQNTRIEEADILEQLKSARVQELCYRKCKDSKKKVSSNSFKSGDRVKIPNKARLPRGRTVTPRNRLVTVDSVEGDFFTSPLITGYSTGDYTIT